jgi:hypothetical protein
MNKKPALNKKLTLNKETLRQLQPGELKNVAGKAAFPSLDSNCSPTCGPNSCLGLCTFNCSFYVCNADAAKPHK